MCCLACVFIPCGTKYQDETGRITIVKDEPCLKSLAVSASEFPLNKSSAVIACYFVVSISII